MFEPLEGRQSILAALQARRRRFQVLLVRQGLRREKYEDVAVLAESLGVPIRYAEADELDSLAHGRTHGGLVAVASPKPRTDSAELLELLTALKTPPLLLLIEGVDDARNLGFVIRSAEALGAHALMIKKHVWDFDAVEVARPSAGAYERLPLVQIDDLSLLHELRKRDFRLVGCIGGARRTIQDARLREPTVLALGGEKRGLSGAVRGICDLFVRIAMIGPATSLSLSHAAAIVLAEAHRQRTSATRPEQPNECGEDA